MRYLAIAVGVAIMLAAAAAWLLVPMHFEAFALLRVASHPSTVLNRPGSDRQTDFGIFNRTQIELIKSSVVARRVLAEPSIQELSLIQQHQDDAEAWLRGQLIVDNPDESEILRVAMSGTHPEELKQIVNSVVNVYLQMFVAHEQDKRTELEQKLDQLYQQHYRDLTKQMDALHQMEEVSKTANSESAKITMTVAVKRLEEALAQRARIRGQLEETARQTMLRKAHDEEGRRTAGGQTADPEPSGQLAGLSLPLLGRQRAFLDEELAETEKVIGKEAEHIQGLGGFSSQVAAKQQELRATKAITNELREELNRIGVEQLSAERITKLDDAVLASNRGDAARKNIVCAVLAIVGLAVIVGGFSLRHRVPGHAPGQEG